MSDENYPRVEIRSRASILRDNKGLWLWRVEIHIMGPDDILERDSAAFTSKEACTEDMLRRYAAVVTELLHEKKG